MDILLVFAILVAIYYLICWVRAEHWARAISHNSSHLSRFLAPLHVLSPLVQILRESQSSLVARFEDVLEYLWCHNKIRYLFEAGFVKERGGSSPI